jgi:hypothetical protein
LRVEWHCGLLRGNPEREEEGESSEVESRGHLFVGRENGG